MTSERQFSEPRYTPLSSRTIVRSLHKVYRGRSLIYNGQINGILGLFGSSSIAPYSRGRAVLLLRVNAATAIVTADREPEAGGPRGPFQSTLLDPRATQTLKVVCKVLGILDVEEAFASERARELRLAQQQFCNGARQFCCALQMPER